MQKVVVCIDTRTGETTYEVEGVVGAKCTDITNILTQSNEVKDLQYTHEMNETQDEPVYVEDL